jgi:hypothetical protein
MLQKNNKYQKERHVAAKLYYLSPLKETGSRDRIQNILTKMDTSSLGPNTVEPRFLNFLK